MIVTIKCKKTPEQPIEGLKVTWRDVEALKIEGLDIIYEGDVIHAYCPGANTSKASISVMRRDKESGVMANLINLTDAIPITSARFTMRVNELTQIDIESADFTRL